ncbi:hypothetical protein [Qiania dongpingensis]|uniref:Uncharacterized protein n=1 Tax=Qiania dongpingensis TaxID=2763669 RepID=A0A7G9G3W0_9FIRM|nr:hypothetical protein [Qiania dongpingensis]QNM05492.1 hypothetical protein H9Q78_13840 [Qiania dongpingensis]
MPERILPASSDRMPVTAGDALLMLTVNKFDGSFSKGVISNAHIPSGIEFYGYGDLLLKMERIYDLLKIPGFGRDIKGKREEFHWREADLETADEWDMSIHAWKAGRVWDGRHRPDIFVQTVYRQHYSWQGSCCIGGQRKYFRSALELLLMIDYFIRKEQEKNNER